MKRVTIDEAVKYLQADDTYRKSVYLILNNATRGKYYCTGKIGNHQVCCVDRSQCTPNTLKANGFRVAYI